MSDLETLTSTVDQLQKSFNFWSSWALYFTLATAFVAITYFGASWMANRKARDLDKAKQALIEAKDQQLNLDLKAKDLEIEIAKRDAAKAIERAEKEALERAKIEERLAWRKLNPDQQKKIIAKLSKFPGTPFQLRVFQDGEALRLMNQLAEILHTAAWKQESTIGAIEISSQYGVVGVTLSVGVIVQVDTSRAFELEPAAKAFAAALVDERIATEFKIVSIERQPDRIHIAVGKNPQ